jgi:hypothetical protein
MRRFSTQLKLVETFPYKFGNNYQNLMMTRPNTKLDYLNKITTYITNEGVDQGFGMAYRSLLDAVCENDTEMIEQMCEKTLAEKFIHGIEQFNKNGLQVSGHNLGKGKMQLDIIDY